MLGNFLKPILRRVVNPDHDDFRKVVFLQLAIFMIISVLMILKPLGTSLMLNAFGINIMPIAFVSIAFAAIIIHFGLILLRKAFPLNHAIVINFSFHILIISAIALALYFDQLRGWYTVAVYVYISLFSVITVTLFFQYCQSLLSIREAKRVLSHVGVGAIAGGVFGGYFTSATVSYINNTGLLLSAVFFLIFAALSLRKVHQEYGSDLLDEADESEWFSGQLFRPLKNKHVIYIVGITCFGVISSKLLDYIFNAVAFAHFEDEAALTAFFGFWFSTINLIGLLIQLFLVNKLIDRLGVTYSMSIMPLMIFGSLFAFLFAPVLAVAIILKMVDGSMKQSLYKTSTEINIMPLSSTIRERAKSLVDVVVDSIATGLSGVLIYILINKVSLPLKVISFTALIIVLAWITFIFLSKKTYLRQLSFLVYSDDNEDEETSVSPIEYIQHLLKSDRRKSAIRLQKLKLFTQESESPIKSAAIELIGEEYKNKGLSNLNHLKTDNSFIVRKKYFEEKLKFTNNLSELNALYAITQPENQIILTGALARSLQNRPSQQKKYQLKKRINDAYTFLKQNETSPKLWRTWMTAVSHGRYEKYYTILKENLEASANSDMKMFALFAVMRGKLTPLFLDVVNCQVNIKNRKRWYKTLATFPKKLLSHLKSLPNTESAQLKRLIPALKNIDKQSHLNFLFSITEHPNRSLRIEAFKTIGAMKLRYPYLNYKRRKNKSRLKKIIIQIKGIKAEIELLNNLNEKNDLPSTSNSSIVKAVFLLRKELNEYLHVLFVLLGLIIESDDMMKCYYGLVRGKSQETLDYLDQLLPYGLKKQIIPVLQMAIFGESNADLIGKHKVTRQKKDRSEPHIKRLDPSLYQDLKQFL